MAAIAAPKLAEEDASVTELLQRCESRAETVCSGILAIAAGLGIDRSSMSNAALGDEPKATTLSRLRAMVLTLEVAVSRLDAVACAVGSDVDG